MNDRPTTQNRRLWRDAGVQALLLMLLLVILFPSVFIRGHYISPADILYASPPWNAYRPEGFERPQNPIMADIVTLFYPMYYETQRCFERGEWPLWNRLELGGMPLLANYETAVFYPPRLLYSCFDVPLAMSLHILLKLWLCGLTAFVCARGLPLSLGASRFFSVAWMLGTYNVMYAPWCLPDVSAWIPIVFLGVHWIAEGHYRRGSMVGALGAVLMMFAGHPELAFGAATGVGVYLLIRLALAWRDRRHVLHAFRACAVFWGVTLLITAVQVAPFLEYVANSHGDHRSNVVGAAWLTPGTLVAFWVPRFFGLRADYNFWGNPYTLDYSMVYPGIAVWAGIAALVAARDRIRHPFVLALVGSTIVHLALAFRAPGTDALLSLPIVNAMAPYWFAVFPIFAVPLLAARGLDAWTAQRVPVRRLLRAAWIPLLALAVVSGAFAFHRGVMSMLGVEDYVRTQLGIAFAFAAAAAIALVCAAAWKRHAIAAPVLTVLLAADLIVAARGINPTLSPENVYPNTALTDYLRELPEPTRVGIAQAQIVSGLMAPYDIEEWLGYDGLYPERVLRLQIELGPDIWNAFEPACAIQYYLHDPALPAQFPLDEPRRYERVHTADGIEVYRNTHALPHAFFSSTLARVATEAELFDRMRAPGFDAVDVALVLDGDLAEEVVAPVSEAAAAPGSAVVEERRGTYVRVRTETAQSQVLTLADAYYPGWTVTIDGEPAPLFPSFYAFRGTVVPAGSHIVEYRYRPWSFYLSLLLSAATLGVLLIAGLRQFVRLKFDTAHTV